MNGIHFLADQRPKTQKARAAFIKRYGQAPIETAQLWVVLGGDGFMLRCLHEYHEYKRPFYGLNFGRVGFLLNTFHETDLLERISKTKETILYPLRMKAYTIDSQLHEALAINEVSLLRQSHQTAKLTLTIDGSVCMEELVADGILLATPAGSTAYNASIHGPILPLGCRLLALTPISPFRPRRWRGALLKNTSHITFTLKDAKKRPVRATADWTDVPFVTEVSIAEDPLTPLTLLFDPHHSLERRIFLEQFM
jgi:NAD+ kinase